MTRLTAGLTEAEQQDVVMSALGSDFWRNEDEITRALQHFELLYRGAHEPGVEFEAIEDPYETFREMLHLLRTDGAKLGIDDESGDVLFVYSSGESVNLSRTRMRRAGVPA